MPGGILASIETSLTTCLLPLQAAHSRPTTFLVPPHCGHLYELQLGPYPSLAEAEMSAAVVRRSHGLSPTVIVLHPADDGAETE